MNGRRRTARGGSKKWSLVGVVLASAVVICLSVLATSSLTGLAAGPAFLPFVPLQALTSNATQPTAQPAATATSGIEAGSDVTLRVSEAKPITPYMPCLPYMAPDGDSYLCYARSENGPELWLGTVEGGFDRLLVSGPVHFRWGYDSQHIVYSPWATPPTAPYPEPVYLMDLGTGDVVELGSTIRGNLIQTLDTGYVAFLEEEGLRIVKPLEGISRLVPIVFGPDQSRPPLPLSSEPVPEETAEARFGFLLTPEVVAPVEVTPTSPHEEPQHWTANPDVKVRFEVSPDGQKVALLQVVGTYATLSILDVETEQATLISKQMSYWATDPFAWSPEGDRLMYAIATKEGHAPELWMVDADGRDPALVLDGGEALGIYDELKWLPVTGEVIFAHIGTGPYASAIYYATNEAGAHPIELLRGVETLQVGASGNQIAWTQVDPKDPTKAQTFFANLSH